MRVLLVNPPPWYFAVPYVGYAILYDRLRDCGHEVEILDLVTWRDLNREYFDIRHADYMDVREKYEEKILPLVSGPLAKLARELAQGGWDVVGVTLNYLNIFNADRLCREIKRLRPQQRIIGGGYSCLSVAAARDISPAIDHYFIGDADESLPAYLAALASGCAAAAVPGVLDPHRPESYRPARPPSPDLVPVPSYAGFAATSYSASRPRIAIIGSRGCPWGKCHFCLSPQMHFRRRDRRQVADEFRYHLRRGMKDIVFNDPSFPADEEDLALVRELIAIRREFGDGYGIEGQCRISPLLSPAVAAMLRAAGFGLMMFGYESGSDRLLEVMNKGVTRAEIMACVRNCKAGGLNASGYFMVGHPDETMDDYLQTVSLIVEMSPYVCQLEDVNTYMFQLGTIDYQQARQRPEISIPPPHFAGSLNMREWTAPGNDPEERGRRTWFLEMLIRGLGLLPEWRRRIPGTDTVPPQYSAAAIARTRALAGWLAQVVEYMRVEGHERILQAVLGQVYQRQALVRKAFHAWLG